MPKNEIEILLRVQDALPNIAVDKLTEELNESNLNLKVEKFPNEPYAAMEWAIPAVISAYLLKPFFEGYFKEAGKRTFNKTESIFSGLFKRKKVNNLELSKTWLKKLITTGRLIEVTMIASGPKKLDPTNSMSQAVTVYAFTNDNKKLKFLFDNKLDNQTWELGIDKLYELMDTHYQDYPNDYITRGISVMEHKTAPEFYMLYNKITDEWEIIDYSKYIRNKIADNT